MKNKIVFLSYLPLIKKFYRGFFIDDLIRSGFLVEYWDLTPMYWKDLKMSDKIDSPIISEFNSFSEFRKRLNNEDIKRTVFIPYMGYNNIVLKLFRLLTKRNATIAFFKIGLFPELPSKERLIRRILLNPLEYFNPNRIKIGITNLFKKRTFLYKKLNLVKKYDIVFAAGQKALNSYSDKGQVIPINIDDFDYYLSLRSSNSRIISYKYCIFLDQDFVSHPDIKMIGWDQIDPKEYYTLLNSFFKRLEQKYDVKVIIATHPKSIYKSNPFDDRPLYKGLTNELVKNSEFCISVASTAVSYPILYKKPIIFFVTNDIANRYGRYSYVVQLFAEYLGCKYYRLDDIREEDELFFNTVDEGKYSRYKYNFITSKESENKFTKDIVIDSFKDFFYKKN